jgi:phospholipase C
MSGTEFAVRYRETFIDLEPGDQKVWRLPPCTAGFFYVSINYADPAPIGEPGVGGSTTPPGPGGVIARYRQPLGQRLGDLDFTTDNAGNGSVGGGTGPALEIDMKLICGAEEPHATKSLGQLSVDASGFAASDKWMLQVNRRADGSIGSRRYRVHVTYPSVLPVEQRRIPEQFFVRGFEANWNANPYLDYVQITDDHIAYRWAKRFAEAYKKPLNDQYIALPLSDYYTLPKIYMKSISVSVGGGPFPGASPLPGGSPIPDTPYLKLKLQCGYESSRTVEIETPGPNIIKFDLPEDLWVEVKLFIGMGGDINSLSLGYAPEVTSPLLDMINYDVKYVTLSGVETVNIKDKVKTAVEDGIRNAQVADDGTNMINDYAKPYIVGHYDLYGLGWDASNGDIVVSYVGKQQPPPPVHTGSGGHHGPLGTGGGVIFTGGSNTSNTGEGNDDGPRPLLFDTPGEMPMAAPTPQRTVDVTPGNLSKIEHIVVLMQENRSFDHLLGYLSRDGMLPRDKLLAGEDAQHLQSREPAHANVEGLLPGDNDRDVNAYNGVDYRSTRRFTTAWPSYALPGPYHGAGPVTKQVSDGMKDFVQEWARHANSVPYQPDPQEPPDPTGKHPLQLVMDYMSDAELPAYGALTREFAICDRWHCSHLGGTLPNRFISLTGDFSRDVYGAPDVENPDLKGFYPLEAPTFFDHLTAHGVKWKLFEHGYSTLRLVRNYTFDETNIASFERDFETMVNSDEGLPPVTFIEPDYIEATGGVNNDDHAPSDLINGQRMIATIMKALLSEKNQARWAKTLFIITYDEHGGFYDHVQPPTHVDQINPDGTTTSVPIPTLSVGEPRLGVRVPAFVISPLIPGEAELGHLNVSHTVFDHTSIPATILRRFCGPRAPYMGDRWAAAKDMGELLTRDDVRPWSDFALLRDEMAVIAAKPAARLTAGAETILAPPLRKPATVDDAEENFAGLMAFASSIGGLGQ